MQEAVTTVPGLSVPDVDGCCPVNEAVSRGVPKGLANLCPCPAIVTVAGEMVLIPVDDGVGARV